MGSHPGHDRGPEDAHAQAAITDAMSEPAFYGTDLPVERRETHISLVFLVGNRAYKLKKAVVFPFVDYGTLKRRHFFCREEIRLNRPLAPRVYRAVRAIAPARGGLALADEDDPEAVEYVVEMERFGDASTLAAHVDDGRGDADLLRRVGGHVAAFHADLPPAPGRHGDRLPATVREDIRQLEEAARGSDVPALPVATAAADAFVTRVARLLEDRAQHGFVREAHGDLRLEHVLVGHPLQLVDRVEFDRALRTSDVAYDLAFAVMELHDRDAVPLADALVAGYRGAGGDPGGDAFIAGLAACRALVRAKIAAARVPPRARELAGFLTLARRLLWRARGPLTLVVCGAAATGKTTLARELASASGHPHLSSDVVRKAQAGVPGTERLGPGGYTPAASDAVYRELGRRARQQAEAGGGAIVDATFRRAADRDSFSSGFGDAPGELVLLRLTVPPAVARERAAHRAEQPARASDAGPELAAAQAAEFEPLDATWRQRATELDADRPIESLAQLAEAAIDARLL